MTESNNVINEKELISILTERSNFFIDEESDDNLSFKSDGSGVLINKENDKLPFSWVYHADKNSLKLVLPNKKVFLYVIQDLSDDEAIKVVYADKEIPKRNTYLIKHKKETKVKEIRSIDLIGFEVDYLWSDSKTNNIYQFLEDGNGVLISENEDEEDFDFKWYIEDSNIIRVGYNSKVIDIVVEEKIEDNLYIVKVDDQSGTKETANFSRITVSDSTSNSKRTFEIETKADKPEKVFLGFVGFLLMLILMISMNLLFLTRGISFFIQLLISIAIAAFFVFKFKNFFVVICKRDRLDNKGKKFGRIINSINKYIISPIENIFYK